MFKSIDIKTKLIIVALIVSIPFILNLIIGINFIRIPSKGDACVWISFWSNYLGNIIGGMIGAAVAFLILEKQYHMQKEFDDNKTFIQQAPGLIKLSFEVQKIANELNRILTKYEESISPHNDNVDTMINTTICLAELNERFWESVDILIDIDLQVSLLKLKAFYEDIRPFISYDAEKSYNEIAKMVIKKQKSDGYYDEDILSKQKYHQDMKQKKILAWKSFKSNNHIEHSEIVLKSIEDLMNEIAAHNKQKSRQDRPNLLQENP